MATLNKYVLYASFKTKKSAEDYLEEVSVVDKGHPEYKFTNKIKLEKDWYNVYTKINKSKK